MIFEPQDSGGPQGGKDGRGGGFGLRFKQNRCLFRGSFWGKGALPLEEKRGTGRGWGFFLQALNACFLQHAECGRFEKGRFFFTTGQSAFGALRPGRGQPRGKPHGKEAWA